MTTYTYQQVFHKISSQMNKFWFYSKMFKSGCSADFAKNALTPNDTPIFCKFLHNNITESSEIWKDGSYWLTESYCSFYGEDILLRIEIWI